MAKEVYIKTYQNTKTYDTRLEFDGTNDQITLPNLGFSGNPDITVEAWIKLDTLQDSTIFNFSATTGTRTLFICWVRADGRLGLATGSDDHYTPAGTIAADRWYHVSISYKASNNNVKIYVFGIEEGSGTTAANLSLTDVNYRIGARNTGASYFAGSISEVRVWNAVRTEEEIKDNLFNVLEGNETNLTAYYKLDEGSGTTATDLVSSNDGTISGATWQTDLTVPLRTREYKGFSIDYTFDSITSVVNNGFGSLTFNVPREFDVLAESDPQNLENYELDVIAYDEEQPEGVILFSGNVLIKDSVLSGSSETVQYTAGGALADLEKLDLTELDGSSIVSYSGQEIADVFKSIIDFANARAGFDVLKYTASSIATTGNTITTTFNNSLVIDALQSVFKSTDSDWVWYIDTDRTVYLKQLSTTADHIFFNNKDLVEITRTEDRTKLVNTLKLWDGENPATIAREYVNVDSVDKFGTKVKVVRDSRIGNTATADLFGTREVESLAIPNDQLTFKVIDSSGGGYDIDSIKVGDTFQALNLNEEANIPSLMVVTQKVDFLDYAEITASEKETFVDRELAKIKKDQFQVNFSNGVNTYTIVNI